MGAAREAALLGHPSIAASIDYKADLAHVQDAAELVLEVAEKYFRAPKNGFRVLNINVPDLPAPSGRHRCMRPCPTRASGTATTAVTPTGPARISGCRRAANRSHLPRAATNGI